MRWEIKEFDRLLKRGEGATLEFKRSTGELREGLQTVCAFLNGSGGIVLFGVRPDGRPEGQQVSDQTLRDIAQALDRFEPPVNLPIERLPVDKAPAGMSPSRFSTTGSRSVATVVCLPA
jgi:predicted HTH transcriptional regulator